MDRVFKPADYDKIRQRMPTLKTRCGGCVKHFLLIEHMCTIGAKEMVSYRNYGGLNIYNGNVFMINFHNLSYCRCDPRVLSHCMRTGIYYYENAHYVLYGYEIHKIDHYPCETKQELTPIRSIFIVVPDIGNAIYVSLNSSELLIYFEGETIISPAKNNHKYKFASGKFIGVFLTESGNILIIDEFGRIVPHQEAKLTNYIYTCENFTIRLEPLSACAVYEYTGGRRTKPAFRASALENSAENM